MSEITAKIDDIRINLLWAANKVVLTVPKGEHAPWQRVIHEVHEMDLSKPITLKITQPRRKRSLDANAYYWRLVGDMARVLRASNAEVHNTMLARYGEPMRDTEGKIVYVLLKDGDTYKKDDVVHLKPTSGTEDRKGTRYRWFVLLRGSSDYDTREMSRLIDGAVSEAQEMGIETLTPKELAALNGYVGNHVDNYVDNHVENSIKNNGKEKV